MSIPEGRRLEGRKFAAIEVDRDLDFGLVGVAVETCGSGHCGDFSASFSVVRVCICPGTNDQSGKGKTEGVSRNGDLYVCKSCKQVNQR